MKNKFFITLAILLLAVSSSFAVDWKGAGFTQVEAGSTETESFYILKDSKGNTFKVRYFNELDEKWVGVIKNLNSQLRQWRWMKVKTVSFFQNNGNLEILVVPSSFTYKGINFIPNIPGGIVFIYDYYLNYNFRLNKDNYFVRINDRFINESLLCERMKEAYEDPVSYLKKREPEYFLKKLTELEDTIAELKMSHEKLQDSVLYYENSGFLGFGNTKISRNTIRKVIELRTKNSSMKAPEIVKALEKEKIKASEKEVNLILNVFYGEYKKD